MTEQSVYIIALPALALLLLVLKVVTFARGKDLSLTLKGLGIELSVHTYGEHNKRGIPDGTTSRPDSGRS